MELNDLERKSTTWKKTTDYCEAEFERLHLRNEGRLDAEDTAELRGQIKALRKLQKVLAPQKLDTVEEPTPYQS